MLCRLTARVASVVLVLLASLIFTPSAKAQTSGLVAAYGFSEGAGPTVADASGNNNTGTLGGGVTWTTAGRYGSAPVFNGAGVVANPAAARLDLVAGEAPEGGGGPAGGSGAWGPAGG